MATSDPHFLEFTPLSSPLSHSIRVGLDDQKNKAEIMVCHFCSYKKKKTWQLSSYLPPSDHRLLHSALRILKQETETSYNSHVREPPWKQIFWPLSNPPMSAALEWKPHCKRPWATTTQMSLTFRNCGRGGGRKRKKETVEANKCCSELLSLGANLLHNNR